MVGALVGLLGTAWLLWPQRQARRPNVLLVTIDTLRADRVGAYGYAAAHTPALDQVAREGLLCRDVVAAAPITMPSHASLLTGLYPPAHGVRDNGSAALAPSVVTLAERLQSAGYTTQAFVSAVVLSRLYGLDQGFATYDDDLAAEDAPRLFMIRDRPASRTSAQVLEWFAGWRAQPSRAPFFTWVHFFDPHQPLEAPAEDARGAASPYDAEISSADRGVGRILDALRAADVLDDTIVIVTADHGEGLGEHGEATHAVFVYDATVRVPLLVRYPSRFAPGSVYDGPVRHVDVVPTLLGMLRLPGGDDTQGTDLAPAWRGEIAPPALTQYSESLLSELGFGMAPLHAVRADGFKWIRAPRPELYDLRSDPAELRNLYPEAERRAASLDRELARIMAERTAPARTADSPANRETLEMLQSLGYLAPGGERRSMAGRDPKDGIAIYARLEEARHLAQQRRWEDAERVARGIVDELPDHVSARNVLGLTLVRQGKRREARDTYLASLASEPQQFRVHGMLGVLALMDRALDDAQASFTRALDINPRFVEAMSNLGLIASLRGDTAGARAWYERARATDPGFPATPRRFGDLYYEQGDFAAALDYYRRALALAPRHFAVLVQAGNSARRVGQGDAAAAYFAQASAVRPDSWIPPYNLACLHASRGDRARAFEALSASVARGLRDTALLRSDPDLASLRDDPRFASLVATR